jgi:hypothetical protein
MRYCTLKRLATETNLCCLVSHAQSLSCVEVKISCLGFNCNPKTKCSHQHKDSTSLLQVAFEPRLQWTLLSNNNPPFSSVTERERTTKFPEMAQG